MLPAVVGEACAAGVDDLHVAVAEHFPAAVGAHLQGGLLVDADADQLRPV